MRTLRRLRRLARFTAFGLVVAAIITDRLTQPVRSLVSAIRERLAQKRGAWLDVVLMDYRLPGLDGVQNKMHPGDPMDKNLYDLEPEEAEKVPHPCASLEEALENLDRDREFLTRGGVFSNDMIDAYIALKMEEVTRFRMTTHPIEFEMYYSA